MKLYNLKGIQHEKLSFNMLSVSKHVVENNMSFSMKVNGCQEKQQKNWSYSQKFIL